MNFYRSSSCKLLQGRVAESFEVGEGVRRWSETQANPRVSFASSVQPQPPISNTTNCYHSPCFRQAYRAKFANRPLGLPFEVQSNGWFYCHLAFRSGLRMFSADCRGYSFSGAYCKNAIRSRSSRRVSVFAMSFGMKDTVDSIMDSI